MYCTYGAVRHRSWHARSRQASSLCPLPQVISKARATADFRQRSRIAQNAYVHQQMLAARAVGRMQQRLGVQPGERLRWCAFSDCWQHLRRGRCTFHYSCLNMIMRQCKLFIARISCGAARQRALCACRLRPPDEDKIYAVLEKGGLGGPDWNQWTRQAVSATATATSIPAITTVHYSTLHAGTMQLKECMLRS